MEESASASLNVDVTKFIGSNMETEENYPLKNHFLLKMLEQGLHADIILTARGGSVKAHRCVLSAISPVFRAMFKHNMKEQLSLTVDIPDMTIEGLKFFLLVIYVVDNYTVTFVPSKDPLLLLFSAWIGKHFDEFFTALLKYQALGRRLEYFVVGALEMSLTCDNCWEFYDISLQFVDELIIPYTVREYIVDNFQDVLQSKECLREMKRNPDRVYAILNEGLASTLARDRAKHVRSRSRAAR